MLVRHEKPQKFEAKWFGPYQVVGKKLLGTYRLQDPNGRELAALVHRSNSMRSRGADRQLSPKRSLAELAEGEAQSSTSADV